ncbi:putative quorum-sensing-regulated virulence factor [Acinetobacter sp. P1(2025)]|uniref:putative quorum-sensing-regulated virulence factor n=1 Tax=Acinetobacter sp. P1(2025) TaxID=3446120 RepID=UPI003F538B9B
MSNFTQTAVQTATLASLYPKRVNRTFYISVGKDAVFYTLRCRTTTALGSYDQYLKNLAIDEGDAIRSAKAYFEIIEQKNQDRNDPDSIVSIDLEPEYNVTRKRCPNGVPRYILEGLELLEQGKMPFGKHQGQLIYSLPDGYVLWLADQKAEIKEGQISLMQFAAERAMIHAIDKGLIALRQKRIDDSKHFGVLKERVEMDLTIRAVSISMGEYGDIIKTSMHGPNGESIIYSGSKYLGEIGDKLTLKATIDFHGTNSKGYRYTIIKRPVIKSRTEAKE